MDRVRGLQSGADDYMVKPFGYKELLARLDAVTRRGRLTPQESIAIGDCRFNPTARTIERDGQSISLRPKEQSLLSCLCEKRGQAVSKTYLLHRVWGVGVNTASTRLQVCIKSLRDKLDGPDDSSCITNVRGFGYRLN